VEEVNGVPVDHDRDDVRCPGHGPVGHLRYRQSTKNTLFWGSGCSTLGAARPSGSTGYTLRLLAAVPTNSTCAPAGSTTGAAGFVPRPPSTVRSPAVPRFPVTLVRATT